MSAGPLPTSITANPILKSWLTVHADNRITVYSGKVELGQGIVTAIAQIAADELGVTPAQLDIVVGDTRVSPDEWYTAGSQSIEVGGTAMRMICAQARGLFAEAAAAKLGVPRAELSLAEGVFRGASGRAASYADLAASVNLDVAVAPLADAGPRGPSLMGATLPRRDIEGKLGGPGFLHDMTLPGLLHGRVVRGPDHGASLVEADLDALRALPGIAAVVRSGSYLCVLAEREHAAVKAQATAQKHVRWATGAARPAHGPIAQVMKALPAVSETVHETGRAGDGAVRLQATYSKPYVAHASIGTCVAVARMEGQHLTIWSHTQGPHFLRTQVALALGLPLESVTVIHRDGAGCYGHNGADDVAFDAALAAVRTGKPVMVTWSREEELAASPCGSASVIDIDAALDADGRVAKWHAQIRSHTHIKRPGWGEGINLLGAWDMDPPVPVPAPKDMPLPAGGGHRNGIALYDFAHQKVDYHFVTESPVRVSALRGLGAFANGFAIESAMDELAVASGQDPVAFRLRHLGDTRARAVIEAAARRSGWQPGAAGGEGRGRGIGFARYKNRSAYCAVVAEVEVAEKVRIIRVVAAVDAGHIVSPDGLANQVEGGVIQALSWTLKEAVRWDETGTRTRSWEDYPILGFDEVPAVEVELIDRPGEPGLGSGECAAGPTAGAVANAVFHAIGVRVRDLPLSPETIARAIEELV